MVAQEILDLKDIDIEFSIKLILIGLMLVYSVAMIWWSNKLTEEFLFKQIMKYSMKISGYMLTVFSPLTVIFLFREVSVFDMLGYLWQFYAVIFFVISFIIITGTFAPILKMFGHSGKKNPRTELRYDPNG